MLGSGTAVGSWEHREIMLRRNGRCVSPAGQGTPGYGMKSAVECCLLLSNPALTPGWSLCEREGAEGPCAGLSAGAGQELCSGAELH